MKAADPEFVPAPVLWRAKAVLSHYGYADVACLFSDLGFDSVTIHGRHRGRKTCDWTFQATRPDRAPMLQQHIDWGNDLESELVIVKESARRGNPANSAPFQPIASGRTVTFGEVAAVAPSAPRMAGGPAVALRRNPLIRVVRPEALSAPCRERTQVPR